MSFFPFRRSALLGALLALPALTALPASAQTPDSAGDTFGAGPVLHDILSTSAALMSSSIQFTVTFAGPIAPASAFAPNSLTGFLDIDTDQNAATGGTAPWGGPIVGGNRMGREGL